MTFRSFLYQKWPALLMQGLALIFALLFLLGIGVSPAGVAFVGVLLTLVLLAALVWEYASRRSFYRDLGERYENLPEQHLLCELVERPHFLEGQLLYDALQAGNKSMNERIDSYRRTTEEYQDYLQSWVHEIKTPIASSRLVLENNPGPLADSLGREMDRIERLVEQVLYYARSNSVEKDYLVREHNLEELVRRTVKRYARPLIETHMSISLENLQVPVLTDSKWLDFILGQLLENAVKYRREQGGHVTLRARQGENRVALLVEDNGIGISPQDLPRVFEKGYTGTTGRSYAPSTGMGLYLCKKLCDKLQIGLSITSKEGEGTGVQLVFPQSDMYLPS